MTEASTASPEAAPAPDGPSGRHAWVMAGSLVVAFALLIGLTWVAGGFEQRKDLRTIVAPGTTIASGPYEFSFTGGTVQKTKGLRDTVVYRVVLAGTGRVTGDEARSPDSLNWMFIAKDPRSSAYQEPQSQQFGAEEYRGSSGGAFFTPGLPAMPYRLTFDFPADSFEAGADIQLGVWILEYRDVSLLQTGDLRWAPSDRLYRYDLPLRRLADDLD
ncbi:MAG TPA: hypothetical protein VIT65_03340 [Microlunatus sp.]